MAGVQRMQLKNLQSNSQNAVIIGIVINSMNPKNFEPRNQKCEFLFYSPKLNINVTAYSKVYYLISNLNNLLTDAKNYVFEVRYYVKKY